jgi:hypothetical protein
LNTCGFWAGISCGKSGEDKIGKTWINEKQSIKVFLVLFVHKKNILPLRLLCFPSRFITFFASSTSKIPFANLDGLFWRHFSTPDASGFCHDETTSQRQALLPGTKNPSPTQPAPILKQVLTDTKKPRPRFPGVRGLCCI